MRGGDRKIVTDREKRKEDGRRAGIRGECGIIIPSINPVADELLVLSCEGVACDPANPEPNETLTDSPWYSSV